MIHRAAGIRCHPWRRGGARLSFAWLVAAAAVLVGCSSPTTMKTMRVSVEAVDALRRFEVVYPIQPGDLLEINQYNHAQFTRKVTVRADGYISLPIVAEVKVAGKTPGELSKMLTELFAKRLRDPEITVIVENPPEPMVYVVGQLGTPRSLPLRQTKTVAQALAQSGDATRAAAVSSVAVIRLNDEGVLESHTVAFGDDDVSQPEVYMALSTMLLRANDLVVVPESYRSQVLRAFQDVTTVMVPIFNVLVLRQLYD